MLKKSFSSNTNKSRKFPAILKILLILIALLFAICVAPGLMAAIVVIILVGGFIPSAIYLLLFRKKMAGRPYQKKLNIASYIILPVSLITWGFLLTGSDVKPETLELSAQHLEMDISSTQALELLYTPEDADISKVDFIFSDDSLLSVDKTDDGFQLNSQEDEGSVTITAVSDDVKSNSVTISIVDQERIVAEKKAEEERIAAEKKAEEERIAAEKKAEEERIAAEKKAEEERIAAQNAAKQQKTGRTVYITPTGKRYHYDNSCNGGTYIESTLDEAISRGLTPCKKCVY